MSRTRAGNRHEINLQIAVGDGIANIQATCVCQNFNGPKRFDRLRAEEDGREHMLEYAKQGLRVKRKVT